MTVAELTGLIRTSIEAQFSDIWLEGEISNLRAPGSGHLYCTLKDGTSQIRAVLFRSNGLRLRFALQEGLHVIVRGRLTIYEPRGEYQIVLEHVEPKGIGALQLAFEQLKERLAVEGLFDQKRKKSLSAFPRTIGLVTSISGAAIHDILTVLHKRWPLLHIIIAPVQVQGEGATKQIADAVASLNGIREIDVIIVGRGGGSWEDLWSFNEEAVVRAIVASRIPVVSAVGHEIDVTLADLAADVRAPTPSAAAEMVVPVLSHLVDHLEDCAVRIQRVMTRRCLLERHRIEAYLGEISHVRFYIQESSQLVDELTSRLCQAVDELMSIIKQRVQDRHQDLLAHNPLLFVKQGLTLIPQLVTRLHQQMKNVTFHRHQRIQHAVTELNNLSPLAILGRGYSILQNVRTGRIIRHTQDVRVGDELEAKLARGQLGCIVNEVIPHTST
ncbi:MAG TPA: exodeoxyribonuclease VII large subunit [Nitrospiraceae bacterium]|nr:exodeoxyribonuclease VII large subunit [Nitrospiraceae bacterium]